MEVLAVDTETSGLDCWTKKILTIQIGNKKDQVVVDCTTIDILNYKDLLEDPNKLQLYWNAKFDLKFLYRNKIYPRNVYDGFLVESLFYLGYPSGFHSLSLKTACAEYCNVYLDKTVRGKIINAETLTEEIIKYAADDLIYLEDIREKQLIRVKEEHLEGAVKIENTFVIPLAYMEYCGIKLDKEKWKFKMNQDKEQELKYETALNNWVIDYFNERKLSDTHIKQEWILQEMGGQYNQPPKDAIIHGSPEWIEREGKQLYIIYIAIPFPFINIDRQGDLFSGFNDEPQCTISWSSTTQVVKFFNFLGIKTKVFDKLKGILKDSVEAKQLKPQKKDFPIIDLYLKYKEAFKVTTTYGQKFLDQINPVTGRIHTSFKQLGTFTTRISSGGGNAKTGEEYLNLLNLPSDSLTRSCFISEPGNRFISIDYSGQETYLMASIANDQAMIKELMEGSGDIHSLTAYLSFVNEIPRDTKIEDIKHKYHNLRQAAKGVEFAINYGGTAQTIKQNSGFSEEEANRIYSSYMEGFSGLAAYQKFRRKDWKNKGCILMNASLGYRALLPNFHIVKEVEEMMRSNRNFWDNYKQDKALVANGGKETPFLKLVKEYFKVKSDYEKKSINYPIQFAGSMCCRFSLIYFFKYLRDNDLIDKVKICVAPYDEINCEAPEDIAEEVVKVLHGCMVRAGKIFCTRCYLDAEESRDSNNNLPNYWIH